jgi:hypothetical protein
VRCHTISPFLDLVVGAWVSIFARLPNINEHFRIQFWERRVFIFKHVNMMEDASAEVPLFGLSTSLLVFFATNVTGWLAVYLYYTLKHDKERFVKEFAWHDLHAIGLCFLSAASLFFDDDDKCPELVPILFTLSYFLVDVLDCIIRFDAPFLIHAVLSIGICVFAARDPMYLSLRAVSCGGLTELSSYPLHQWQRSNKKADFIKFAILFTLCRVLWIPYFLPGVYDKVGFGIPVIAGTGLFLLNFAWWFKILYILLNYEERAEQAVTDRDDAVSNKKEK